jgi:hypothetical protein
MNKLAVVAVAVFAFLVVTGPVSTALDSQLIKTVDLSDVRLPQAGEENTSGCQNYLWAKAHSPDLVDDYRSDCLNEKLPWHNWLSGVSLAVIVVGVLGGALWLVGWVLGRAPDRRGPTGRGGY